MRGRRNSTRLPTSVHRPPSSLASTILQRNFSHDGALTHDITAHFFRVIPVPSTPPMSLLRPLAWPLHMQWLPGSMCKLSGGISSPGASQHLRTKQRPIPGSRLGPDRLPDPVPPAAHLCSGRPAIFSGELQGLVGCREGQCGWGLHV